MTGPRPGRALALLGWLLAAPAAGLVAARMTRYEEKPVVIAAQAITPSGLILGSLALTLALATGRRALAVMAGASVTAHLRWMLPQLRPPRPLPAEADGSPRLRVFTANLRTTNARMEVLAGEILAADADVVLVQELSFANLASLRGHGVVKAYPFRLLAARADAFGTGILSRLPLTDDEVWQAAEVTMTRGTVMVGDQPLRFYCVHPRAPFGPRGLARWRSQLTSLQEAIANEPRPLVVAGDFNATWGQRRFRDLLAGAGLRDAHVEGGRAWATTWPSDLRLLPPLTRVDHVLVSPEVTVLAVREGEGAGSDHRPVVADLVLTGAGVVLR